MHPKSVPFYFLGASTPTRDYQLVLRVLQESLEFVRAYLEDLLCISKLSLEDHLEKLEEVLGQLCDAGLKVNAEKSTFCTLEIEYLGYVLTRDGIKPQSDVGQSALPTLWGLGRMSTERRNGLGF